MSVRAADQTSRAPRAASGESRPPVSRAGQSGIAWWLWPHVVSLDAPAVAVVWQWMFARALRIDFLWADALVLGLGVWLIYLGDRLVDAARIDPADVFTSRHAIHARWRGVFSAIALVIAAGLALLTPILLPRPLFVHGLSLLGAAGAYFWLIHGRKTKHWTRFFPKEAAVGSIFAAGTAFLPWDRCATFHPWVVFAVGLFGGLCFCNCALISVWERHAVDLRDRHSFLNAFPRLSVRLPWLCIALALGACCGLSSDIPGVFLALSASGVCLAVLDFHHDKLSANLLRVLADTALMTPLLFGLFGHG